MSKTKSIEGKVAETILQKPEPISVGGKKYDVAPPTIATLILASEEIAKMPQVGLDTKDIVTESLFIAKDCRVIGDIVAILILGARGLTATEETGGVFRRRKIVDRKSELSRALVEDLSPKGLLELLSRLLSRMEISDFFALSTFLIEINLTKARKVEQTTASGQ